MSRSKSSRVRINTINYQANADWDDEAGDSSKTSPKKKAKATKKSKREAEIQEYMKLRVGLGDRDFWGFLAL